MGLATPSGARAVLARHGHRLGKSLGQHLLVDQRVLDRIVSVSGVGPADTVLEVGPGIGTLTAALARASRLVIAVEADRRLEPVLDDTLAGLANVRIVWKDALALTSDDLGAQQPTRWVSNLPYNVAATLILALLDELPSILRTTVMVQREVGERMTAAARTKAYGAYTVKLALRAEVDVAFRVPRASFLPPPRVDSVVVTLARRDPPASPPLTVIDAVVDAAFSQRRKMLRSALPQGLGVKRDLALDALVAAGIDGTARAEALTAADFTRLARECSRASLVTLRSYPANHKLM